MPIDTIVFDFGGVLIDWNPRHLYKKMIADEQQMEWFLSNVCTDDWNVQQDKGRTFAEATSTLQEQFPDHKDMIALFYGRWEEMLNGEIAESVAVLHELKEKQYKLYGLTNWSTESFPIAQQRYEFLTLFDGILVSGEEKLIKPDPAIFQLLLSRYNLAADNSVFIDDNIRNVEAAGNLGFTAIHFQSGDLLRSRLVELNVLPEAQVSQ